MNITKNYIKYPVMTILNNEINESSLKSILVKYKRELRAKDHIDYSIVSDCINWKLEGLVLCFN